MKNLVSTPRGPKAIGPYSQAVRANGFIFVSGQLPIDAATGFLVRGGTGLQTEVVLENLKVILEAAGSSLTKAVKATIYLKDMNDFAELNEVYARYFASAPPARSMIEVARLPKDARVEIDLIAVE